MLVFSTPLVKYRPTIFSLVHPPLYHFKQNLGEEGASQTPAAKSLYSSIFKKSRHLGLGVFIHFAYDVKKLVFLLDS